MDPSMTVRLRRPGTLPILREGQPLNGRLRRLPPPSFRGRSAPRRTTVGELKLPRTNLTLPFRRRPPIDGLSDDLNAIASWNLDHAPARRLVRDAFKDLQLQLDHCLFKLAPVGIRKEEWYERNSRGLMIFCKSWLPDPEVRIKGALFFSHGYGDTCTFFFEGIAEHLVGGGYAVYAIDHPGFGLSDGLHGYISNFDGLADNVIEQYEKIKERPEVRGLPCFLLGQSMGGAVALKVHLNRPYDWNGIVLVAPMCRIADDIKPPEAVIRSFNLMSRVMPTAKLYPAKDLSELALREPRKRDMAVYNVICYNKRMRLKTASELLRATTNLERQIGRVSSPLLILHGAADKVTDPSCSRFLYEKASSKDKTLRLYEDGYHCILEGEPDNRILTVLSDILGWLDARSSPRESRPMSADGNPVLGKVWKGH
ncbi:hypothetical protein MLD38_007525 [Melastoma candidum]|uniref:Uncharacterized protein n=1 Tax=Melastoma candidum TaxID=119954 RepID=A0ACB9RRY2_9MYRT|nr:hypothetical protein MLD38_007525 [Melastoma candidum]